MFNVNHKESFFSKFTSNFVEIYICIGMNLLSLTVAEELEHELFEEEEPNEHAALMQKVKGHNATPIARQMSAMSSHSNDVIDSKAETDEVSQIR